MNVVPLRTVPLAAKYATVRDPDAHFFVATETLSAMVAVMVTSWLVGAVVDALRPIVGNVLSMLLIVTDDVATFPMHL